MMNSEILHKKSLCLELLIWRIKVSLVKELLNISVTVWLKLREQRGKWLNIGWQNQADVRIGNGIGHLLGHTSSTASQAVRSNPSSSVSKRRFSVALECEGHACSTYVSS